MSARPHHAALGITAAALAPVAGAARVVGAVWRSPLGAPVRRPAVVVYEAAAHRGELIELRLRAIARDEVEYRIAVALDDPRLEELIDRALASRIFTVMIERVRTSDEVLQTVEAIAGSDAVRSALTSQTTGLAREVADEVRTRTARVDDGMEAVARRFLRRAPRPAEGATVEVP